MNEEHFENKLHALTPALTRPDPTPAWKTDILARARREANAARQIRNRLLPPRWLVVSWLAAWAAIAALHLSDLAGERPPAAPNVASTTLPTDTPDNLAEPATLMALHHRFPRNLDFSW